MSVLRLQLAVLVAAIGILGCRHKAVVSSPPALVDNDYLDLSPGGRLRITVPYFTSGGYVAHRQEAVQEQNGTIVLSTPDFIGFQVSNYYVAGRRNGAVELRFESANTTVNGKMRMENSAPPLPFALPRKGQHVRLIYLVRSSQSDHNMAIASSPDLKVLDQFTSRLKSDPDVCRNTGPVNCVWVPQGISVRPE